MLAASRIYDGQLPAIATTASSPDLSGVSKWTFRVISSDSLNGVILARFASRIGGTSDAQAGLHSLRKRFLRPRSRRRISRAFRGTIVSFDPISEDVDAEPFVSYLKDRNSPESFSLRAARTRHCEFSVKHAARISRRCSSVATDWAQRARPDALRPERIALEQQGLQRPSSVRWREARQGTR